MKHFVEIDGGITAPKGFKAVGVKSGVKKNKADLAVICSDVNATAAACFTKNDFKAAPVMLTMKHIEDGYAKAVVINSGNANACTGQKGAEDAMKMAEMTAKELGVSAWDILVASTGVIGKYLPMDKIQSGIKEAAAFLKNDDVDAFTGSNLAAEAILTTDTFLKQTAAQVEIGGKKVTIAGMAKGSGMIHPNMATMLSFITTDADIDVNILSSALRESVNLSYNMITVDGDSSTNDMVICLANGMAENNKIIWHGEDYDRFYEALHHVNTTLAKMIAKDGEGATKLIEVQLVNAKNEKDAKTAAKSIVASSLVKAAFFGEDANWGRIIAALGYSGVYLGEKKPDISFISADNQIKLVEAGEGLDFDEADAKSILESKEITILVDLKAGKSQATAWGCDLSYDYVKINASYRS